MVEHVPARPALGLPSPRVPGREGLEHHGYRAISATITNLYAHTVLHRAWRISPIAHPDSGFTMMLSTQTNSASETHPVPPKPSE